MDVDEDDEVVILTNFGVIGTVPYELFRLASELSPIVDIEP
jgi:hypothetical protein